MNRLNCFCAMALAAAMCDAWAPTLHPAEPTALSLPAGRAPAAIDFAHFPTRMHALVWRNWPVVPCERIAAVLKTSPDRVEQVARSMGLPPQGTVEPEWNSRGYVTIIRRNWHLVPYEQLLELVDMTAEQLEYSLREDDFLFHKLGDLKPQCAAIEYEEPDEAIRCRAADIRSTVESAFGPLATQAGEPRFGFLAHLEEMPPGPPVPAGAAETEPLRYIYSYAAVYGDALSNPVLDPYPEGLLQRLSQVGVTGVWIHTVLRTLAPSGIFPEFGRGHEQRLAALKRLVERASHYGIRVYLYVNEPRAMPAAFFSGREQYAGVEEGSYRALCTSDPAVRRWLADSLAFIFGQVPQLGGVFTITASENLTSCASHHQHQQCPRCRNRDAAEIIAEVNAAVEEGVHRSSPEAKVIVWDWGWRDDEAERVIARLPAGVWLQSVSEWSLPVRRGGVETTVGEYSISAVGPGPRATRHWQLARQRGLKTVAKVQFNNTWELSAVPYLPVYDLVARHASRLALSGVDGMMLSWTLGGYPSPVLELVHTVGRRPDDVDAVLDEAAQARFGQLGGPHARRAWTAFSRAFEQYPYHTSVLYRSPVQYGPANLLFLRPTGYSATMVGLPYDHLGGWRGPYPVDTFAAQFEKLATMWQQGVPHLAKAVTLCPPELRPRAEEELRIAKAAQYHFASVANQVRFVAARDRLLAAPRAQRGELIEQLVDLTTREEHLARELYAAAQADSRIGFEASNHYYYVPLDLVEKVVNCRHTARALAAMR